MNKRFKNWKYPEFDERGITKWNWMCQHHKKLKLSKYVDIGAFTYINAKNGVEIGESVQIGSHCSIYSISTIDKKEGKVVIKKNAKIGSHSVIMPGVTVGDDNRICIVFSNAFLKFPIHPHKSWMFGLIQYIQLDGIYILSWI
ncbi:MAG: acyltransferase [Candidatus Thermoplasmatota archaeon]|nr:acyltransferase [Candidatus Thermoplasmatota archaeon]